MNKTKTIIQPSFCQTLVVWAADSALQGEGENKGNIVIMINQQLCQQGQGE